MPLRPATIFRVVVILALAVHAFFMYSIARVMREEFGLTTTALIISSLFALAMMIPLFWAAWLPDVPDALAQWRATKRWSEKRCPACNYDIARIDTKNCPECGAELIEPARYEFSIRTLRRFAVMSVIAWIIGVSGAEANITLNERTFQREALEFEAQSSSSRVDIERPRSWPNRGSRLHYRTGAGFSTVD